MKCILLSALPILLTAITGLAETPKGSPDDPGCTAQDRVYMARAYELARYAITHGGGPDRKSVV